MEAGTAAVSPALQKQASGTIQAALSEFFGKSLFITPRRAGTLQVLLFDLVSKTEPVTAAK